MHSLGYDNIVFHKHFNSTEWNGIRKKCRFVDDDGNYHFLLEKIFFSKLRYGNYLCNINVPKLFNDQNITLAVPEMLNEVFDKCERLSPIPLNLRDAPVRKIDFAFTQDTPFPYQLWKDVFALPKKGNWNSDFEPKGIHSTGFYFNGSTERLNVYMADEKLRHNRKILPFDVALQCDYERILRVELRMDRLVKKALAESGLWIQDTLIGSDLCTAEGFLACVKYFLWRVPQFIKGSKYKDEQPLHGLEQLFLCSPHDFIKLSKRLVNKGKVEETVLSRATSEILALEAKQRPKNLLLSIREECKLAVERYSIREPIIGELKEEELKIYAGS